MKSQILLMLLCCTALVHAAPEPKSILFVAGTPSHGWNEHEFHEGCKVLSKALGASGLNVKTTIHYDTWPERGVLDGIDALVVYCDGDKKHVVRGHEAELQALAERGVGLVFLHYAVDGEPGLLNETLMKVIGGYYDDRQSKNPEWMMKNPALGEHAITTGVNPFELKDEWYYHLKFGAVTPVLEAVPPEEGGSKQILAWAYGANAFGFTGGHFLSNWAHPDFRKLILNAMVWSAGMEVPVGGVQSVAPVLLKNKSILHAIARGDADDVRSHLLLGTDVNEKNKQGWTLLHFAAVRGKTECVKVLVENGAELDLRTGIKKTPLHLASERGFLEITTVLVEKGADLGAQDDEGWSPLHYAAEKDRTEVAAFLIKNGAVVDLPSKRGGTALHEASASASPEMIKLLLKNGADKNIKATNGKTPLDYAIELENQPAAAILK